MSRGYKIYLLINPCLSCFRKHFKAVVILFTALEYCRTQDRRGNVSVKLRVSSRSSFYALFGRKLNEELSSCTEDQEVLSEAHFIPEIVYWAPTKIFSQFHWLFFLFQDQRFYKISTKAATLLFILTAFLPPFHGNPHCSALVIQKSSMPHPPLTEGTPALGTVSQPALSPLHRGATAFPSAQPSALPPLRQQWKIPFCLKGELHAKSRWQNQETS